MFLCLFSDACHLRAPNGAYKLSALPLLVFSKRPQRHVYNTRTTTFRLTINRRQPQPFPAPVFPSAGTCDLGGYRDCITLISADAAKRCHQIRQLSTDDIYSTRQPILCLPPFVSAVTTVGLFLAYKTNFGLHSRLSPVDGDVWWRRLLFMNVLSSLDGRPSIAGPSITRMGWVFGATAFHRTLVRYNSATACLAYGILKRLGCDAIWRLRAVAVMVFSTFSSMHRRLFPFHLKRMITRTSCARTLSVSSLSDQPPSPYCFDHQLSVPRTTLISHGIAAFHRVAVYVPV